MEKLSRVAYINMKRGRKGERETETDRQTDRKQKQNKKLSSTVYINMKRQKKKKKEKKNKQKRKTNNKTKQTDRQTEKQKQTIEHCLHQREEKEKLWSTVYKNMNRERKRKRTITWHSAQNCVGQDNSLQVGVTVSATRIYPFYSTSPVRKQRPTHSERP